MHTLSRETPIFLSTLEFLNPNQGLRASNWKRKTSSMSKSSIFVLTAFTLLLGGCDLVDVRGNGHVITEQRPITEFTEIAGSGGLRIEWHSGAPSLSITTDENLLGYVENRVADKTLRLRTREHIRPTHGVKITVSSTTLSGADLNGAVDLIAKQVAGPKFYLQSRGASDVTVDGSVEQLLADMTGATELRTKSLQAKTVEISTAGAASANVTATETLRVSIVGAGDVSYFGNPKNVEKHITGAGSVRHKE
jgi:Putative auto-transporter adhesin, head GIN domain